MNSLYKVRRVLEYTSFFNTKTELDVISILKKFSRSDLIRMAALLSLHFGNFEMPNPRMSFFSEKSKKYGTILNNLFERFYKNNGLKKDDVVQVSTFRTSLELWRLIFSIPVEDFSSTMPKEDMEINLFKIVLALNEKIYKIKKQTNKALRLDEIMYLNQLLNNDSNEYDLNKVLQPQAYYFFQLINFIPTNDVMKLASDKLLADWGLTSWKQYYVTIIWLAKDTDDYFKEHQSGVPIIPLEKLTRKDETGLFASSLIEHLCFGEDDYIPAEYDQTGTKMDVNVDYRRFRSKPFIKLKDGSGYIVINIQILCERLYNSLFFDFSPLINGCSGSVGLFDYNKGFVEKVLFQNTIFNCLGNDVYTWPKRDDSKKVLDSYEPDFYARYPKGELLIIECKAIKMNGGIKDEADYDRLLDELHEKIVLKTRNLDPTRKKFKKEAEPIGIGQLIHHINSIEADTFEWDKNIPEQVAYYPIIVFEDVRILRPGLMSILNKWFYEEIKKIKEINLSEMSCMPLIPISINTLYLYDDKIKKKGLHRMIDEYIQSSAKYRKDGTFKVDELSDFDGYLRMKPFQKDNEIGRWLKKETTELI